MQILYFHFTLHHENMLRMIMKLSHNTWILSCVVMFCPSPLFWGYDFADMILSRLAQVSFPSSTIAFTFLSTFHHVLQGHSNNDLDEGEELRMKS